MRHYVNLDTGSLLEGFNAATPLPGDLITVKRGDTPTHEFAFGRPYSGAVEIDPSTPATFKFGVKVASDYAGAYLTSTTAVTKTGTGSTALYTFAPSYNTRELNDAMVVGTVTDDDPANQAARYALTGLALGDVVYQEDTATYWTVIDIAELDNADGWELSTFQESVDFMGELEWVIGTQRQSTITWTHRVYSDVNRGSEGVPTGGNPEYPTVSQVIAQVANSAALKAIATTGLAVGMIRCFVNSGALEFYQLQAGTTAETAGSVYRPTDYAGSTNEKIWVRVG